MSEIEHEVESRGNKVLFQSRKEKLPTNGKETIQKRKGHGGQFAWTFSKPRDDRAFPKIYIFFPRGIYGP